MNIVIHSQPEYTFYDGNRPPGDIVYKRLISVSNIRTTLRISGGETPNGFAEIDNGDGRMKSIITGAMHRDKISIYDGTELVFSGVIRSIKIGQVITLGYES